MQQDQHFIDPYGHPVTPHIEATTKGEKWLHKLLLVAECVCCGEAHGLSVCIEEPPTSVTYRVLTA